MKRIIKIIKSSVLIIIFSTIATSSFCQGVLNELEAKITTSLATVRQILVYILLVILVAGILHVTLKFLDPKNEDAAKAAMVKYFLLLIFIAIAWAVIPLFTR